MRVDVDHLRERMSRQSLRLRGLARRTVVSLTNNDGIWQALGYRDDSMGERFVAEVFPGIGFYARPAAGAKPEAIIIHIGAEPNHPVIIATRDKSSQVALNPDETVMFNSQSVVLIKNDGTVEVRSRSGSAVALAKKSELDTLKTAITNAAVVAGDGGAAFKTNILAGLSGWPVGTTKLRGE